MIDLIYDFILNVLIGETEIPGVESLAILLTFAVIVLIVFCLIRLVVWVFNVGLNRKRARF